MKHGDRPGEGFKAEKATANGLRRQGARVEEMASNNKGHDLKVNGKKVEVKAAVETSYKGSDGYPIRGFVFSNMKKNPNADKYILKCMSPDRSRTLKEYHIPASQVKQRTLTLTRNSKYEGFRKKASQQLIFNSDGQQLQNERVYEDEFSRAFSFDTKRFLGRMVGVGALTLIRGRALTGKVDFGELTRPRKPTLRNQLEMRFARNVGEALVEGHRHQGGIIEKAVGADAYYKKPFKALLEQKGLFT